MIDWQQASDIADKYVAGFASALPQDDRFIILYEKAIEKPYGWIFFYTSKRWHETGDFKFAVAGNAPFLVTRDTGRIRVFGTALPVDQYIEQYERTLP